MFMPRSSIFNLRCGSPRWLSSQTLRYRTHLFDCPLTLMQSLDNHFWKSRIFIRTKLKLYSIPTNLCVQFWMQMDACRIDVLDQQCLRTMLGIKCNVMSMWSLRWHFTNKSVTGAPYSIRSHSLSHNRTLWWRVRWLKHAVPSSGYGGTAAMMVQTNNVPVVRRVDGMTSVDVEALRRRWHEPTSAVEWRASARNDGAVPTRQWYARTHNPNWIISGTFSQCSSQRSGVMCSYFLAENTRQAAALKTDCSRCNSCLEIPERTELQNP